MIPATWSERRCVAEAALDFIGKCDGLNHSFAGGMRGLSDRKNGCNVVRRVRRFLREISIIEIKIADECAVGERGEVGKGPVACSPHSCAMWHSDYLSELTCDPAWRRSEGPKRTAQAVQDPPLNFVYHGAGHIIVAKGPAIPTQSIRKHWLLPLDPYLSCTPHVTRGTTALGLMT